MKKAIQIDEDDNVATVTSNVSQGEAVEVLSPEGAVILKLKAIDAISFGHKVALDELERGDKVIKYDETIGITSRPVKVGEWVHTHNVESATVPTSARREGAP